MDKNLIEKIKKLREETGAPINLCKEALENSNNDIELAKKYIMKKGEYLLQKKDQEITKFGLIEGYIHFNGRVGSLVELRAETDFVTKSVEFKSLAHEIALQVATMNPRYLSINEIPQKDKEEKIKEFIEELKDKPENIKEKVSLEKMNKWYSEICLLEQPYFKDENLKIKDLIHNLANKFGEKIEIKRFVRFSIND